MLFLIILFSYLLGCLSTVALLFYLYTRYALYPPPTPANENEHQQFEDFQPLPEDSRAKNSAVDTVNYIFQFLFQELKDSSRLRRYLMHKLDTEFKELQKYRAGSIFLQNIVIESFSIGNQCPVFSDIRLQKQERDERGRIKEFIAHLDAEYQDGFSVTLDVTLLFGHKCKIFIRVKHIKGLLRLEFLREPFSHWLLVFQNEPSIDFEVKSYFATVERPQLAHLITQQLRRAIKRKQTWPSYKIRYTPFFPTSKEAMPTEILSADKRNLIPGKFQLHIKHCDRLSIPFSIFDRQKMPSVVVLLTVNINEKKCVEYLHIDRTEWPTKEIELPRSSTKLILKEVNYMDRTELLIENIDPFPSSENPDEFKSIKEAMQDRNLFLMKIQGQEAQSFKQTNRLLKYKSTISSNDSSTSITTMANQDKLQLLVGMPLLHSVRVSRVIETLSNPDTDKTLNPTTTLTRSEGSSSSLSSVLRQRTATALTKKSSDGDEESIHEENLSESPTKSIDILVSKKGKSSKTHLSDLTLIMMNTADLSKFQARPTKPKKAESYIDFDANFEFQVGPQEKYLNIALWCKPPLDCDVPNPGTKFILLGYATMPLSEIVLDAHMSFKRETQMTLNFRSAFSPKPNLNDALIDSESKKRLELSSHKGYDDNMAHGFVTINIRHQPDIQSGLNVQEQKEQFVANGPVLTEIRTNMKDQERKQEQLNFIKVVDAQQQKPMKKPTDHDFEDKAFTVATTCASCLKKIWMKTGRQCRECQVTIHRKCEDKFNANNVCSHESINAKSNLISPMGDEDLKSLNQLEMHSGSSAATTPTEENADSISLKNSYEIVSMPTNARPVAPTTANRLTTKAAAALSVLDSTARRSLRALGQKNANLTANLSTATEFSKSDESLSQASVVSSGSTVSKGTTVSGSPASSSKLVNAASSAYSKIREFKSKRTPNTTAETNSTSKSRTSVETKPTETISESDLRGAISNYLSDETNDIKGLENYLQEKTTDDSVVYSKAREFGAELFRELTPEKRKEKLDSEISRLQQEIDLQCQIRDEMIRECEQTNIDENEKRKLRAKITNIDDKVQALGALTILYCSGLKHCRSELESQETSISTVQTTTNELDETQNESDDDVDEDEDEDDEEEENESNDQQS